MNGAMLTNIRKDTFNFKLHCIELSFVHLEPGEMTRVFFLG